MKKILILSANPKNTSQLRLQEEEREIKQALKLSKHREEFEIVTESALQVNDLRRALLDNKPDIVHFSGHGAVIGSQGDNNQQTTNFQTINNSEEKQIITQAASEIKQSLQRLEQNNPSKTNSQKMMIAAQAVVEIESNPTFKNRVINALKTGGKETFKELINHPLANIFMACIDDW